MGLLDALVGSSDPSTADPSTGLVEAQRRQLAFNTLGQTGAILLAAGQNLMPEQRAQLLAQLGNVPGNVQAQSSAMSQQNLEAQRVLAARRQNQQQQELAAYLQTPEFQEQFKALPPAQKAVVIAAAKSGNIDAMLKAMQEAIAMNKWQAAPDGTLFNPTTGDVFDPLRQTRYNINQMTSGPGGAPQGDATGSVPTSGGSDLTGEAFLQTLPAGYANMLRGMIAGKIAISPQLQSRPGGQKILADLTRAEPGFEGTDFQARAATAKDFAAGKSAQNATSLNTVIGHLGSLHQNAAALKNVGGLSVLTQPWNYVANQIESLSGKTPITQFYLTRNAVADELSRAFKGANLSDTEVKAWKETVNAAMSPEQLQGAVEQAIDLLNSRIGALQDQYRRGFGKEHQGLLEPKSKATLAFIQSHPLDHPEVWPENQQQGGTPRPTQGGVPPTHDPALLDEARRRGIIR
jgi:hypothetical protein